MQLIKEGIKTIVVVTAMMAFVLVAACSGASSGPQNSPPSASKSPAPANGQTKETTDQNQPTTVADIAAYDGTDREQLLVEGAKKEGTLSVYSSMAIEDMQPIVDLFEDKYGITVHIWRAGANNVLQRVVTEARANRHDVDVIVTGAPEMEALYNEQLLQEVKSPFHADLVPEALQPHNAWVATRLNVFTMAYNTNLVQKEELPQRWEDLLDPNWKGRLGIEATDIDWFAQIIKNMGEEKGLQLFRDIVATNGISVREGHTLLTNLVVSGEIPLALTVYNYKPEQLKKEGAPIEWYAIEPAIVRPHGVGVAKNAQNPHGAVLFYDFMISEAQPIMLERDFVPTSNKVDTPLNKIKMQFVEPSVLFEEYDKWEKLWNEIIIKSDSK